MIIFIFKVDAQLNKMQHHVTGVKVHSIEKTFILTWTDMFHPDCNVTLNTLVYVLHAVSLVSLLLFEYLTAASKVIRVNTGVTSISSLSIPFL
jgi:hypothetical protein